MVSTHKSETKLHIGLYYELYINGEKVVRGRNTLDNALSEIDEYLEYYT